MSSKSGKVNVNLQSSIPGNIDIIPSSGVPKLEVRSIFPLNISAALPAQRKYQSLGSSYPSASRFSQFS